MTEEMKMNKQLAWPTELEDLVKNWQGRPGWIAYLDTVQRDQDHGRGVAGGLTLVIVTQGYDAYHPEQGETYRVTHYFPVIPATYDRQNWAMWLLNRVLDVEVHETCEFFQIDGHRPFAPHHGPGEDPYTVWHPGLSEVYKCPEMSFRGTFRVLGAHVLYTEPGVSS